MRCKVCEREMPGGDYADVCESCDLEMNSDRCPKCKGKGTLPGSNYVAPNKSGPPNCFACNGEGVVR